MDAIDYPIIRQLFDDYLRMYSSRDDRLTTYFSENFSGFTGGGDFLVKDKEEWVAITRQDFDQIKDPIRIELKDLAIQSLADTIAVATGFFTIYLPIKDHILSSETARLVLIFRLESAGWKISHSSISIPYHLVREGEIYPMKELVDRNQFLEKLVAERTIQLSDANDNLKQTNEKLAYEIAEHKQTEEELKKSLSLLSASLESTADGILIVDRQGKIVRWNQKFAEMWQIPQEALSIGDDAKAINSILTQLADPVQFTNKLIELYKQPEKSSFEQIEFADGRVFEHYSQPQRMGDTIVGRVWSFSDITARKQAENELRESEDIFRLTFNFSPDAVNINRLHDGLYMDINEGFTRATGYTHEDVIGKTSLEINVWQDSADRQRLLKGLREKGIFENLEAQFRKKDGSLMTGLMSARVISLKGESHIISITRDITERKRYEKEQLKIEKLESLGILAGGIAHDFNNILTGIMGNISLAKVFLDTSQKSYKPLAEAEKATVRAGELAHQLLTFARGGEPIKKVVSPQYLVNEAVSFVLRGSNVKGTVDIPDSIHAIEADEGQMSQVFHNLIINATQAMPGGGALTVIAQNEMLADHNSFNLPPGTYIRLTLSDQGCGIEEDTLKRIFDPYFTTKATGIGLGLASVHSIVSRHGGHIGAHSVIEKGTIFTIHLPSIGKEYTAYEADVALQATGKHKDGSILVMDDDELIRDIASLILIHLGYQVNTCTNGQEAIEIFKSSMESGAPFLAIIMDLTIPGGLGGKQAAEQILSLYPTACLIVSSGYSNDPIMSNYKEYGFSGAIAKPYNILEVEKVLNSLLTH